MLGDSTSFGPAQLVRECETEYLASLGTNPGIRARRIKDDTALKARLSQLVAINYGALAVATLGLMCVILGLFLS